MDAQCSYPSTTGLLEPCAQAQGWGRADANLRLHSAGWLQPEASTLSMNLGNFWQPRCLSVKSTFAQLLNNIGSLLWTVGYTHLIMKLNAACIA